MDNEDILFELFNGANKEELFQKYKNDENLMKKYLPLRPNKYSDTPNEIKKNVEICKEILKKNSLFFRFLDPDMKANHEVQEAAVDVHAANYKEIVSNDLGWKRYLLLKILNNKYDYDVKSFSYNFSSSDFEPCYYSDKEVILAWLKHKTDILTCIDKKFLNDVDIANTAIETNGLSIFSFSQDILNNKECVLKAVKSDPIVFEKLSDDHPLKNDDDVKNAYNNSIIRIDINDILSYMDSDVKKDYDYGVELNMPYIIEKSYTTDPKEQICSIINAMLLYNDPIIFRTAIEKYRLLMSTYDFITSEVFGVKTKKIIKYCNIDSIFKSIQNDETIEISDEEREKIENLKEILSRKKALSNDELINRTINVINRMK